MLSCTLYEYLERRRFAGLPLDLARKLTIQLLQALLFLSEHGIAHCDIKPENIMFKADNKSGIKLVDFGSGCYLHSRLYSYVQSRFYRAPEVILGGEYACPVDMWSLGCVLAEIVVGLPLFPAESEQEQVRLHVQALGPPPPAFLARCSRSGLFFHPDMDEVEVDGLDSLVGEEDPDFKALLRGLLEWDPEQRITPQQALTHPFILKGLPGQIRVEHLREMRSGNPYGLGSWY